MPDFSHYTFPPHFVGWVFWCFYRLLFFSLLLHENEGLLCLCLSSGIYFYCLLAIQTQKIVKLLKKSER